MPRVSLNLAREVHDALDRRGIAHVLIGGAALAAYGLHRSTLDLDFLALDPAILEIAAWRQLGEATRIEIHRGDLSEPLAGTVRLRRPGERPVDVVVGRFRWQREIVERAVEYRLADRVVRVPTAADYLLLKLSAGGARDAWDVAELLASDLGAEAAAQVDRRIADLPESARAMWRELRERS